MVTYRIRNDVTGEIMEKSFANFDEAGIYESMLDFVLADYEVYLNGERV